jgi:TIR domain
MSYLGKPARALELFYSYSQKDERYFKELEAHLSVLKQQGYISVWHECNISAGIDWRSKILTHLDMADIILLLISSDFLASEYYQSIELKRAIEERHCTGKARIIPIILRECAWKETIIEKLQALPTSHKPVTHWKPRDKAWMQITQGIRQVVEELTTSSTSASSFPSSNQQDKENNRSMLLTEKQIELYQQIEQERYRQSQHVHIGLKPMKIDKDIIIRYDLDMQMSEFSRRLNFGGAYPFLLSGQDNVLRDYIIERMCRELKNKLGRPHRRIDIRLVREDITDVQHIVRKKILGKEYNTLIDLFKEEVTRDVVLTIWNYFFPPDMLRIAAHYFWEDIVTDTLPFLLFLLMSVKKSLSNN